MQNKTVVGLGYIAQAGKDTIADYLVNEYGFRKTSFATALKEAARAIFGFTEDQLYGPKEVKEAVDPFWNARLNIYEVTWLAVTEGDKTSLLCEEPFEKMRSFVPVDQFTFERLLVTPRLILQLLGTEAGRNIFGQCLWVETVARRIFKSDQERWVIPDARFPNEVDAVQKWNGKVYEVKREIAGAIGGTKGHASENSLQTFTGWDGIIDNNSSFPALYKNVEDIIVSTFRR